MKLIVNADDFGMSRGVNYGIYDAHKDGIVTSTTLMVTMPEVEHALELWKSAPKLKVGLHLNITLGKPLSNCPSLLKPDGTFFKPNENPNQDIFLEDDIYNEFKAQYEKFIELTGKLPSHFDSHLYAHQKYDKARSALIRLASEVKLPIRDINVNGFPKVEFAGWFKRLNGDVLEEKFYGNFPEYLQYDFVELMVHPAYIDDFLIEFSTYSLPRVEELDILTSSKIKDYLRKHNVELISYEDVRK